MSDTKMPVSGSDWGKKHWNTIAGAFAIVFPDGTGLDNNPIREKGDLPAWPTDVFAFAAYLIERGGVYHRLKRVGNDSEREASEGDKNFVITEDEIEHWKTLGQHWRNCLLVPHLHAPPSAESSAQSEPPSAHTDIKGLWDKLTGLHSEPVVSVPDPLAPDPLREQKRTWPPLAYALLVIADEAARGLGYDDPQHAHLLERVMGVAWSEEGKARTEPIDGNEHHRRTNDALTTYAVKANPHVVRIMPKSHTPTVGNTMRTLTHNLALVPPWGVVDMAWQRTAPKFEEDREPLNLLLVPFPYKIGAQCFDPEGGTAHAASDQDQWRRRFHLDQRWLMHDGAKSATASESVKSTSKSALVNFFVELIRQAQGDAKKVHGLLLPEYALDWPTYQALVERFLYEANDAESIEYRATPPDFMICGASGDCCGKAGNYVLVTTFHQNGGKLVATTHSRPKHHRWRLTGSQISDYGLSAFLDPQQVWWEATEIPRREVGLTVFRRNSILSAMICEDLARSEPCHEPLKTVGPNLVFALLMDGSQLPDRWSARYATSLADDPGCSVLTLTSLGLIERTTAQGKFTTRNIALWKDRSGHMAAISCAPDRHGILLTLGGEKSEERTFDGRLNDDTASWRYQGHQPITISRNTIERNKFDWIVKGPVIGIVSESADADVPDSRAPALLGTAATRATPAAPSKAKPRHAPP